MSIWLIVYQQGQAWKTRLSQVVMRNDIFWTSNALKPHVSHAFQSEGVSTWNWRSTLLSIYSQVGSSAKSVKVSSAVSASQAAPRWMASRGNLFILLKYWTLYLFISSPNHHAFSPGRHASARWSYELYLLDLSLKAHMLAAPFELKENPGPTYQ